jgi:hypothetical protein
MTTGRTAAEAVASARVVWAAISIGAAAIVLCGRSTAPGPEDAQVPGWEGAGSLFDPSCESGGIGWF